MSKWEFVAPKFWDLSESIIQDRPNESWFIETNISAPSFPKKRRLRHKFDPKNFSLKSPEETVYDRLARESTISFSRKINPSQKRLFTEDQPPTKESERIAQLETSHKSNIPRKRLKLKTNRSEPSKPQQLLYEEMKKATPVIQPISQQRKKIVMDFFQNLLLENQRKKLATKEKVESFFENLKLKNKLLYKNIQTNKEINREVIEVSDSKERFRPRKRTISATPIVQTTKRPRVELK